MFHCYASYEWKLYANDYSFRNYTDGIKRDSKAVDLYSVDANTVGNDTLGMKNDNVPKYNARQRIAWNLKRLRHEQELSQEKAAELADFHRTYVSQLERCITNISIDGLERLAAALGVDIVDLLKMKDDLPIITKTQDTKFRE